MRTNFLFFFHPNDHIRLTVKFTWKRVFFLSRTHFWLLGMFNTNFVTVSFFNPVSKVNCVHCRLHHMAKSRGCILPLPSRWHLVRCWMMQMFPILCILMTLTVLPLTLFTLPRPTFEGSLHSLSLFKAVVCGFFCVQAPPVFDSIRVHCSWYVKHCCLWSNLVK